MRESATKCPWCGASGPDFDESPRPSDYCHHDPAEVVKPLREREIEAYLVKRAKECGGEVRKVQWIGRRGAPDRVVMLPRQFAGDVFQRSAVWVELKAPGKTPEPHQLREHKRMRAMGQRVLVVDSLDGVDALFA